MIRWPQDALIFSVKAGPFACYAAGYVEGDLVDPELLGAMKTADGPELVSVREIHVFDRDKAEYIIERTAAEHALVTSTGASTHLARSRATLLADAHLHPDRTASGAHAHVIIVEELPGNVSALDLVRRLFTNGEPPSGIAARIVRTLVDVLQKSAVARREGFMPARRLENILLSWDGGVFVQPRVELGNGASDAFACGRHLAILTTGLGPLYDPNHGMAASPPPGMPPDLASLAARCLGDAPPGLDEVADILDAHLRENPCGPEELAGVLAGFFPRDRQDDLEFREELGACDIDALNIPAVNTRGYDASTLLSIIGSAERIT